MQRRLMQQRQLDPRAALSLIVTGLLAFTVQADEHADNGQGHGEVPTEAVAKLIPTVGYQVNGVIVLKQMGDDVHVTGEVWNLTPGEHGFHIHEFGDMRASDGTSAGGHYNPDGHDHAGLDAGMRHAGDMGNIMAGRDGRAKVDLTAKGLKLHFVIGRSIVVHAGRDDLTSQPSGNAGPRAALGVIGFAEMKMDQKTEASPQSAAARQPTADEPAPPGDTDTPTTPAEEEEAAPEPGA